MTRDFSPISKFAYILIIGAFIAFLVSLSYGWSLDQTSQFAAAITGPEFAKALAWLIQLGPQVCLAISAIALAQKQRRLGAALIVVALTLNFIDAYTNLVVFRENWPTYSASVRAIRSADFVDAAYPVGMGFAFLITWGEEAISLALGTALVLFAELAREMRWNLPPFFRAFLLQAATTARSAGGDFRGIQSGSNRQRPQHAHGRAS